MSKELRNNEVTEVEVETVEEETTEIKSAKKINKKKVFKALAAVGTGAIIFGVGKKVGYAKAVGTIADAIETTIENVGDVKTEI